MGLLLKVSQSIDTLLVSLEPPQRGSLFQSKILSGLFQHFVDYGLILEILFLDHIARDHSLHLLLVSLFRSLYNDFVRLVQRIGIQKFANARRSVVSK